jgi:hypothetical protein
MNERIWELPASAAMDRELDAEETLELLDSMADDADCRTHWRRLREFDQQLAPLVQPAVTRLPSTGSGVRAIWWLVPVAAAAILVLGLFVTRGTQVQRLPGPGDGPLTVRLAEHQGEMSEARFVEIVVEVLQADPRYQAKMIEVLEEVRPEASLAEGGSPELDPRQSERLALGAERESTTRNGELPYEAVAGIH